MHLRTEVRIRRLSLLGILCLVFASLAVYL
ncbi:MAG: hypothetical protein QOF81_3174, partial [Acidimicrobiaceae bacterium]|nr:hypothetical protein [Acidimicrobiaceae bacterium]